MSLLQALTLVARFRAAGKLPEKKKKPSEPPFSLSLSELARRRLGQRTRYPQNHTQTGGEVCSPPPAEEGGLEVAPLLAPLALEDKALLTSRAVGRLWEPASSSRSSIDVPSFSIFFFFWAGAFPRERAHFSVYFFCREMRERERERKRSSFCGESGRLAEAVESGDGGARAEVERYRARTCLRAPR